jgi:hypothetical protein
MKGLSFYDIRKINEANLKEMKGRMQDHIKKKIQEHRMLKDQDRVEHKRRELEGLEDKQADVLKQHKIDQLIKSEQKAELDRNIAVFRHLNKEEKGLRRELCDKQVELQFKERYLRRVNIRQNNYKAAMKKEERDKFIGNFAQAKNLIEKQMKLGNFIRD